MAGVGSVAGYGTGARLEYLLIPLIFGIAATIWPEQWLRLFSAKADMIETGSAYLRIVGPTYGFFGLGLSLYFASQGAGRLYWPLTAGFLRIAVALGVGWIALSITGSLEWLLGALTLGLVVYGMTILAAVRSGAWFRQDLLSSKNPERALLMVTSSNQTRTQRTPA